MVTSRIPCKRKLCIMVDFRLANILLHVDDYLAQCPEVLFRNGGPVDYRKEDDSLAFSGRIDFMTYFNAVSCCKWMQYADVDNICLHLELAGDACIVQMTGIPQDAVNEKDAPDIAAGNDSSAVKRPVVALPVGQPQRFSGAQDFTVMEVPLSAKNLVLGGFTLDSEGATEVRAAYWYAPVEEDRIRPIKLALSTTTFKKEEYIVPNIQAVKDRVVASGERIADNFHMFVVDNGRTLDAAALSDDGVTVIPNANTGGAGGFARGMIEALDSDFGFTHVLLMDDDVRVSPESFKRTFNLLSLANDRYADAFINGAMLQLERPNMQFEDVSIVRPDGAYERLKGNLYIDQLADSAVNETIDVEQPQAYGAWWFSCIPLSAVRAHGLPLPLFVRCDDVEFGMRCEPVYMTMNGICVWHEGFGDRFRASVDCYQYMRNYLIMVACDGKSDDKLFMLRAERHLRMHLRTMAYETAELLVSGFEDYLKGPEFLMNSSGEEIMKANGAANEKLVPLADLADQLPEGFVPDPHILDEHASVGLPLKLWRTMPYDRHFLPDALLRDEPGTVFYGGSGPTAAEQVATRTLVACDRSGNAHIRTMDRVRYARIHGRWRTAMVDYREHKDQLAQEYRDAMPQMTSEDFWKKFLGIE